MLNLLKQSKLALAPDVCNSKNLVIIRTIVIEADGDLECTLEVSDTSKDRLSLRLDRSLDRELSQDSAECILLSSNASDISHSSSDES